MSQFTSVSIIFNPNSTGDAKANAEELKAALAKGLPAIPVTLLPTAHAGHAEELAYTAARSARPNESALIVSASGDGGYNEVVNGVLKAQHEGSRPICAVLPSGNANDHARTMQDKPLAESITANAVTKLDILQLTRTDPGKQPVSRYAHSYIGLGLTPSVAIELNKHTLNSFKEAWIICKTFWNMRPVVVRSGGVTQELDSLICSTIPEMAKVITLSKDAEPNDGLFEMTKLPHNQKRYLIFKLVKSVFSSLGATSRVHDYTCQVLKSVPIQLDGEIMELPAETELTFSLQAGLLRTII